MSVVRWDAGFPVSYLFFFCIAVMCISTIITIALLYTLERLPHRVKATILVNAGLSFA